MVRKRADSSRELEATVDEAIKRHYEVTLPCQEAFPNVPTARYSGRWESSYPLSAIERRVDRIVS